MSILLGPFEKGSKTTTEHPENDKELLVFGYQCRLYKDDEKATLENDGLMLIPWMGDRSLMVDRYDVRNRFDDKSQFGLKSNLPHKLTEDEEEFERLLDEERYLALGRDIMEEELLEEEQHKRMGANQLGSYREVQFSYGDKSNEQENTDQNSLEQLMDQPERPEHLPTEYIDNPEEGGGEYQKPPNLYIPSNIQTPHSQKLHAVVERTALFISKQGQQMEIIIKTKQRFNPSFSFLHHEDRLFPYYKHILNCIKNGLYEPQQNKEASPTVADSNLEENEPVDERNSSVDTETPPEMTAVKGTSNVNNIVSTAYDEDSDSDEELHPILRANMNIIKPKAKPEPSPQTDSSASVPNSENSKFKSRTFKSIAYSINSAPTVNEFNKTGVNSTTETYTQGENQIPNGDSTPADLGYTICNDGYDPMAAYLQASQVYYVGVVPPPPNIQPVVDKTAEYVAKNGEQFESTIILKHLSDAKFDFLHPWNQYNRYYKTKVTEFKEIVRKQQESAPPSMQKLNDSGGVRFKMAAKAKTPTLLGKGAASLVLDEDEENGEQDLTEPVNKKVKISEEEIMMDNTIKQFLLTVKGSIT